MLGASATHFSLAASFFTDVRVVGVVGDDFGEAELAVFAQRGIDADGHRAGAGRPIVLLARSLRLRHAGRAHARDAAERLRELRAGALRRIRATHRRSSSSATSSPTSSARVREQCRDAPFVGARLDELWIETARDSLSRRSVRRRDRPRTTPRLRMLDGRAEPRPRGPGRSGPGARDASSSSRASTAPALFTDDGFFSLPGYPLEHRGRPDRRGRLVRGRLLRLPRPPRRTEPMTTMLRCDAPGLRVGDRVLHDRGVRQRARAAPDARTRSRPAVHRVQADDPFRAGGSAHAGPRLTGMAGASRPYTERVGRAEMHSDA